MTSTDNARSQTEEVAERPEYTASLRLVWKYVSGSYGQLFASIAFETFATACDLVPVWAVYRVIKIAIFDTLSWHTALLYASLALVCVAVGYAAQWFALRTSHIVAFDSIYRLRLAISRYMALLPLGYFANHKSGDAKNLVVDEPEKLELILAHGLPEGISAFATWLAVSIWLFVIDWRMAIATILVAPISVVMLTIAMSRGARRAGEYQRSSTRMNASIVEYLAGMPVVKMFNRTGHSLAQTTEAVNAYSEIETQWARDYIPLGGSFFSLILANIIFILPIGMLLMTNGSLDLPTFLLFVLLGANYSRPLLKLFNQFHTLAHISMGSMRVMDLLNEAPQKDTQKTVELENHDIVFENVCFAYENRNVLNEVSFTAKSDELTALVGPSGSGKSTIASLVPRFWDVRSGKISIGGIDVREIGIDQLMDTIAFVFQDTFLFSDTIGANIRYGNPNASDEEVIAAAKAARAHEFIMSLPEGYDTPLGEHGGTLSGGERQRLAIARAILKDAPVVVLDEATAFADPDNEAAIQEAIGELTKGRTLIVVAHRLHTIANADNIVVVRDGSIAEQGRHDELLGQDGTYARLWHDYTVSRTIRLHGDNEEAEQ